MLGVEVGDEESSGTTPAAAQETTLSRAAIITTRVARAHTYNTHSNKTTTTNKTHLAQHAAQKGHQAAVLGGELEAERADRRHDDDLEVVGDVAHEAADLLEQLVDARLVAFGFVLLGFGFEFWWVFVGL